MTRLKSLETLMGRSERVAFRSNGLHTTDLGYACESLYRHQDGHHFFRRFAGAALDLDCLPRWVDRAEAVRWTIEQARDPVTGYGYSSDQAEILVDGGEAGEGRS